MQDLGLLRNNLGEHSLYANSSTINKSRTVASIVHQSWSSLIGVVASRSGLDILLVSAYLPAKTDVIGEPDLWDPDNKSPTNVTQAEVHSIYASLAEWTSLHPLWFIGGDLNGTISVLDRFRVNDLSSPSGSL